MSCSNKRRKRERGNAVLEFAIGWSVLWAIFGGVYQYGYSFYVYNRLMTAVSNAAQLGSKIGYDTGNSSDFTGKLQLRKKPRHLAGLLHFVFKNSH